MGKLLVEESTEPIELRFVAEIVGRHFLVESLCEDAVIDLFVEVGERLVRTPGFAGRFGVVLAVILVHLLVGDFRAVHLARVRLLLRSLVFIGGSGIGTSLVLGVLLVLLVRTRLLVIAGLAVVVVLILVVADILGQFHG
jgi:hypothetical protein